MGHGLGMLSPLWKISWILPVLKKSPPPSELRDFCPLPSHLMRTSSPALSPEAQDPRHSEYLTGVGEEDAFLHLLPRAPSAVQEESGCRF